MSHHDYDPTTDRIPTTTSNEKKKKKLPRKIIAAVAIAGSTIIGGGAMALSGGNSGPETSPRPTATDTLNPGHENFAEPSAEFLKRQHDVDVALPYLQKDNDANRAAFEESIDLYNPSNLRGANYFKDRGYNYEATANMSPEDALDWVHLQIFRADEAARTGDLVQAEAIAAAVAEGKEYNEILEAFKSDMPNVNASFVTRQAPILEVSDAGSIAYTSGVATIDQPGTKLYGFTAFDTDGSVLQYMLRFTPATDNEEGAWALVTTEEPGTLTSADVSQY